MSNTKRKKQTIGLVLPLEPGYSETFFVSKIKGLQANGYKVVLFVQELNKQFDLCEVIQVPRVHKNKAMQLALMCWVFLKCLLVFSRVLRYIKITRSNGLGLVSIIKSLYLNYHILSYKKLDWLHFGFATQALGSEFVAETIGAKMAVSFRGFDIAIYPLKHGNCYKFLWQTVDKVHTISNDLLEEAYRLGLPKRITVSKITPAIDTRFFQPEIKKQFSKYALKLLTVARLHWKKGLVSTLEALAILKSKGVAFSYTIVGQGEEYERLAFAIHQLDLQDEVVLAGKLTPKEVKSFYEQSDVYIQYSISEGFCNAVLEAQSMGLLSVVSDAEGLSENVKHNETGWVVPKLDPIQLAERIEWVSKLTDKEFTTVSKAAKSRVEKMFNIKQQQDAFVDFYAS